MSQEPLRDRVRAIAALAGIPYAQPHRWRHTVATLALERTRDLRGVQEFLGHASLASTQIYTGVVAGRLQEISASLGRSLRPEENGPSDGDGSAFGSAPPHNMEGCAG